MQKIKVLYILLIVSFSFFVKIQAQDSIKIIILSNYIGEIIDASERKEYNILPIYGENFISAYFYQDADSQYYCSLNFELNGIVRDTIIKYNFASIRNTAQRIQYYESIKSGKTDFNLNDVELMFADKSKVTDISPKLNIYKSEKNRPPEALHYLPIVKADRNYSQMIEKEILIGLSIGMVYNSAEFDGLAETFNLLEDNIAEEPYHVPNSNLSFNASPLYRFSSLISFKKQFIAQFGYEFNITGQKGNLEFESFSVSVGYLSPNFWIISSYASLGYSASSFLAKNQYNIRINNQNGILESIELKGNVKGFSILVGFLFNIISNADINIFGDYKFYPDAVLNTIGYQSDSPLNKVNAKGFGFGLTLNYYFYY